METNPIYNVHTKFEQNTALHNLFNILYIHKVLEDHPPIQHSFALGMGLFNNNIYTLQPVPIQAGGR